MISSIILAAGESRRMGTQNKLLLQIGSEVLIRKFVESVCASAADAVLVVLGHEAEKIKAVLQDQTVRFVNNTCFEEGMTTSIQSGVKAASTESTGLMICLADLPFAETSDFNRLIQAFTDFRRTESSLIIVPVFQGQRGNPVLFSAEFRDKILTHKGEGCREIVRQYPQSVREVSMENDNLLRDIDTPEDYKLVT
ncbi:MAG: nucleotidyltransferase family protein [Proteobacteria bacterium]|jgi:molybdenum cofactor cytidylyltransferase|nr:nucleotidyltransferase family protein [Pseudomonadota bacterium]MDB3916931.1 nucleotidyltransferase family protein [bacterium]